MFLDFFYNMKIFSKDRTKVLIVVETTILRKNITIKSVFQLLRMVTGRHKCTMGLIFSQSYALHFMVLKRGPSTTKNEMSFLLMFVLFTIDFPLIAVFFGNQIFLFSRKQVVTVHGVNNLILCWERCLPQHGSVLQLPVWINALTEVNRIVFISGVFRYISNWSHCSYPVVQPLVLRMKESTGSPKKQCWVPVAQEGLIPRLKGEIFWRSHWVVQKANNKKGIIE